MHLKKKNTLTSFQTPLLLNIFKGLLEIQLHVQPSSSYDEMCKERRRRRAYGPPFALPNAKKANQITYRLLTREGR